MLAAFSPEVFIVKLSYARSGTHKTRFGLASQRRRAALKIHVVQTMQFLITFCCFHPAAEHFADFLETRFKKNIFFLVKRFYIVGKTYECF